MSTAVKYILLLLFLAGFTFTGHNKTPLLSERSSHQEVTVAKSCSDTFLLTRDHIDFLQLFSFVNDDSTDDESDIFSSPLWHRFSTLYASYYQALFLATEKAALSANRSQHMAVSMKRVPLFISFHNLLIPSHNA